MTASPQFILRFVSGKYEGGEFPIRINREIVIGRGSELDLVLVEDMVSRKHAKLVTLGGEIVLHDLGSTNGTFVNGERIRSHVLKPGDRILIGTSIIKLLAVEPSAELSEESARLQMEEAASRRRTGAMRSVSGTIDEIPLPDMLQLLATSRKSGVFTLQQPGSVGRIYMRKGQVYFASLNDAAEIKPRKALFRLLTWTNGTFELGPPDERTLPEELKEPTQALLMEGMRQIDELRRLEQELPRRTVTVGFSLPLAAPLRDLTPADLDVLQLVMNQVGAIAIQAIVERSQHTDYETLASLQKLLALAYIRTKSPTTTLAPPTSRPPLPKP